MKFYSNKICPFAHRVYLTLAVKGISYEFIHCELKPPKPQFFTDKYREALGADPKSDGKVPILELEDGRVITESGKNIPYDPPVRRLSRLSSFSL
jgi:glutathione S-transferase